MRRLRASAGWQSASPVSLGIKTLPADADPYALRVARAVADWYRGAGIDATVTPMATEELYRQVLLDNDFDLFVARTPERFRNPDELYALLHSRFAAEPGWQNPFGYTNLDVDDLLAEQRSARVSTRRETLETVQREIARTQPFSVVAFPDEIRAARADRYVGWHRVDFGSAPEYLSLEAAPSAGSDRTVTTDGSDDDRLRIVVTDRRLTENLNPLAVEFRRDGSLVDLVYDPLGYETAAGSVQPWLADSWEFTDDGPRPRARVSLRPGLTWHDGEPLTAADVAFTYRLLADVTLGRRSVDRESDRTVTTDSDAPIPAPRFRGRSSLVADAHPVDERTVTIQFADCSPRVGVRALTVPVFPEHVWADRTDPSGVGGLAFDSATEALVTNNVPPVGSGPFAFERNVPGERLVLERFDDHFLADLDPDGALASMASRPPFERIVLDVVGSGETAVSVVANDEADVTGTPVGAETIPRIGRASDLDLFVDRSLAAYVVGYNTRRPPLTNPRFRHALARLVDQEAVVTDVFDGYARPAVSPLDGTAWVPEDLQWGEGNPVTPFLGSGGTVDTGAARAAFRDVGYEYDDGTLVERN